VPIHFTVLGALGALFMFGACGFAVASGGKTEQQGGAFTFVAWIGTLVVEADGSAHAQWGIIAIDSILFLIFVVLATNSHRSWPIWSSAFQAIGIFEEVAHELGTKIDNLSYIFADNISGNGVIMSMAIGAFVAWRERKALKAFGIDPQLETSSPASARSISSSVRPTPKMATKDPKRGPWF